MTSELQQRIVACYKINYLIITCIKGNWVPENLGSPRLSYQNDSRSGWGWGIHVNPWLIHVNVWQKSLQYCKVISLQLIKINGKKTILLSSVLYIEFMHKISLGKKKIFYEKCTSLNFLVWWLYQQCHHFWTSWWMLWGQTYSLPQNFIDYRI